MPGDITGKGKGSPYSITEHRAPKLIVVLGSQPAGDLSHKPGGRLPLLSARPAVTGGHYKGGIMWFYSTSLASASLKWLPPKPTLCL